MSNEIRGNDRLSDLGRRHLDCLFDPDKNPPALRLAECLCPDEKRENCDKVCFFDSMSRDEKGNVVIHEECCTGCPDCIESCKSSKLKDKKEILPVFELVHNSDAPVYAMIAPAFISQFSEEMTPGKLRSAFKKLGFAGMIEVALFADILTLKEALEFDRYIKDDRDFMLTSCCCPMWIAMIRRIHGQLVPHMPPSVSPMVACGRSIKKLYPEAKTVFIGPCLAKKAEAKEPDVRDAVDYVLTFQEMQEIFDAVEVDPLKLEEDLKDHSSMAGRIYARTGGVSEAVQRTLDRLRPNRKIPLVAQQANGVKECKELLNDLINGNIKANFIEGMGCVGGCVGGPKSILDKEVSTKNVNNYGNDAQFLTPVDNPYVIELLQRLGFDTIDSLLEHETIFTRDFNPNNK
ncbi:[Fe-Fe] hydrogenase large subunit C-terminal domain-containing protein [Desulfuribacillus alkaliarsenatis]|uniref:Iron hydrogenase n=1 Tax=Desulfuribacillus alkaliarsenatis TaxID=766136 RepID=A0A1E5G308_9FIRM|nr:[Fe-Fe] hydrogenase large subunit C-terminal domain-containing protein [Desulfuribacillus alkaliarsenatis]OEF97421.1 iron hydrogenase [Desulfuribacillus alkaliarsenatis]